MTKKSRSQLTTMDKFSLGVLSLAAVALVVGIFTHKNVTPKQVTATVPVLKDVVQPQDVVQNKPADVEVAPKHIYTLILSKEHTLFVTDEIGENAYNIAKQILVLSNSVEPTVLILNSPGGNVISGAQIISAIEASQTPVYTVVTGLCASMCAMIAEYADKRFMVDRTILMFHPASMGGGMLNGTMPQIQSRFNLLDLYTKKMDAYVALKVGLTTEQFLLKINNELWLDSEDALNNGYIDGIVSIDTSAIDMNNVFTSKTSDKLNVRLRDF